MPIINNEIIFSATQLAAIKIKSSQPGFSHTQWGDDDLLTTRQTIREHYRNAQRLKCAYCMNPISSISASGAHIEHIIPKSKKIEFIFEPKNLCVICPDCNEIKRDQEITGDEPNPLKRNAIKYPRSSGAFRIVHPHFDDYDDHIIRANRVYIDRTPKGHWTIGACKLNRFFHRFGVCEELVEDVALIAQEEEFHELHRQPI